MVPQMIAATGDWAASNGYTAIYTMSFADKLKVLKALFKQHIYYRCKIEVDDFQKGLNDVGALWDLVQGDPAPFACLFVRSHSDLTFSSVRNLYRTVWSHREDTKDKEEETMYCWEQFLRKAEAGECFQEITLQDNTTEKVNIGLHQIIRFCTGGDEIPPMGFEKQIDVGFFSVESDVRAFPTVSTCGLELHLPRGVEDTEIFIKKMTEAIICSPGFGKV